MRRTALALALGAVSIGALAWSAPVEAPESAPAAQYRLMGTSDYQLLTQDFPGGIRASMEWFPSVECRDFETTGAECNDADVRSMWEQSVSDQAAEGIGPDEMIDLSEYPAWMGPVLKHQGWITDPAHRCDCVYPA